MDLEMLERMGWTSQQLYDEPEDVVIDLRAKWAAEGEYRRLEALKRGQRP